MKCSGSEACSLLTMFVGSGMLACSIFSDGWSQHYPRNSIERVHLSRGIIHQCIATRREKICSYRFHSLLRSMKLAFSDTYEVYTDHTTNYRHLPTQGFEILSFVMLLLSLFMGIGVLLLSPLLLKKQIAISSFLILVAAICCLLGCLSYFHANYTGSAFTMQVTQVKGQPFNALICEKNYLGWSFFMSFCSGVMFFAASFCLCISERVKQEDAERSEQRTVLLV